METASQLARSRGPTNANCEVDKNDGEENQSPIKVVNDEAQSAQSNSSGGEASDLANSHPRLY